MKRLRRHERDELFGEAVRWLGLALAAGLGIAAIVGHLDYPSGFVLAAGMIFYKGVADKVRKANDNGNGNGS